MRERYANGSGSPYGAEIVLPLTKREMEIVLLVADGHRQESIANQLDIAIDTVNRHKANINEKLRTNSSIEIAAWYYKTYWIPKPPA